MGCLDCVCWRAVTVVTATTVLLDRPTATQTVTGTQKERTAKRAAAKVAEELARTCVSKAMQALADDAKATQGGEQTRLPSSTAGPPRPIADEHKVLHHPRQLNPYAPLIVLNCKVTTTLPAPTFTFPVRAMEP